jgi:chemotaxis protein MotB
MLTKVIFSTILISFVFSSCVSSKKYKAANAQIDQLNAYSTQQAKQITELQNQVNTLTAGNKEMTAQFSAYRTSCENTEKQLNAYKTSEAEENEKLKAIEKKVQDALVDFNEKGVEVYLKDDRIYVNMEDNLLYKSGSAKLGAQGKEALSNLAMVLNDYPKLQIVVVGHTDDVKFKNTNNDNLSLSTERANVVVRVLKDEFEIDPLRLTAAGKGKYAPIGDNQTAEGRAKNRRTEIILNPDLNNL